MTNKQKTEIQKEIVDSINSNPNGRLLLAPRVGKTKIGIDIIKREKPNTILWVTPHAELADTVIPQEFEIWKAKKYINRLTTSTWVSLNKVIGKYDLIILDEEQYITESNAENLLNGKLSGNIISMTGTSTKHKAKLDLLNKLGLKVLYDMSINEAVDIGLLSNYTINVLKVPYDFKNFFINKLEKDLKPISKYTIKDDKIIFEGTLKGELFLHKGVSKNGNELYFLKTSIGAVKGYLMLDNSYGKVTHSGTDYQLKLDEVFSTNTSLLTLFSQIKKYKQKLDIGKELLSKLKGRILCFAGSIEHAESLCDHTYHSKTDNKDLQSFMSGLVDRIAMVNSGGTGFTYKELDHLVLLQSDSDKNGNTSQKICRTLLKQKNYKATIWMICLEGTQDERWVESALENFDRKNVNYVTLKDLYDYK